MMKQSLSLVLSIVASFSVRFLLKEPLKVSESTSTVATANVTPTRGFDFNRTDICVL